jgi:hypothetical protein
VKKEIVAVILFGFILGLIVMWGIWVAKSSLKKVSTTAPTPTVVEEKETSKENQQSFQLTLLSPEDGLVSNQERIDLTGKTSTKAVVAVAYPDGEKIIETDDGGNFKTEVTLIGGGNEIEVTAYAPNENQASQAVNVIYSTAKIE